MDMYADRLKGSSTKPIQVEWRWSIAHNAPFIAVALAYILAAIVIFQIMDLYLARPMAYLFNGFNYAASVGLLITIPYLYLLLKNRPDSPIAFAKQCATEWRLADRFRLAAPAIFILLFFMPTFSAFKSSIPSFQPFVYDPLFADWDAWLHGGDAWLLIHPLVGYPFVSFLINAVYHLWILLLYAGVVLVAASLGKPKLRMQFLISYALCWILLGTIGAILMSSVGPTFYDDFFGNDRYEPLMTYLYEADEIWPLPALEVQETLLLWAANGSNGLGRGITAMPSMHLSIACLFAILGWKVSRFWGIASTIFLLIIMIGSVHLGYHYAIDGYVSVVLTLALWWAVGWTLDRFGFARMRISATEGG